jgi:hypothetical protein
LSQNIFWLAKESRYFRFHGFDHLRQKPFRTGLQGAWCRRLATLQRNLLIYGLGGVIIPFIGIKLIDVIITAGKLV